MRSRLLACRLTLSDAARRHLGCTIARHYICRSFHASSAFYHLPATLPDPLPNTKSLSPLPCNIRTRRVSHSNLKTIHRSTTLDNVIPLFVSSTLSEIVASTSRPSGRLRRGWSDVEICQSWRGSLLSVTYNDRIISISISHRQRDLRHYLTSPFHPRCAHPEHSKPPVHPFLYPLHSPNS